MKIVTFSAILAVSSLALGAAAAPDEEKVLFHEPFDGRLSDGWAWVREEPKDWKIDPGSLVVRTSTGSLWEKQNNNHNLLLRTPPDAKGAGLAVEVLVENEPTNGFEHAGLVWYYDDDNYVMLNKEKLGGTTVQLVSETDAKPKVGFAEKAYDGKTVWLRLEVSGGKAVGRFRATDKDDWQTLGQCDLPVKGDPRVGLITGYAAKDSDHTSRSANSESFQSRSKPARAEARAYRPKPRQRG